MEELTKRMKAMSQRQLEKVHDQMTGIPFGNLKKLYNAVQKQSKVTAEDAADAFGDMNDIADIVDAIF